MSSASSYGNSYGKMQRNWWCWNLESLKYWVENTWKKKTHLLQSMHQIKGAHYSRYKPRRKMRVKWLEFWMWIKLPGRYQELQRNPNIQTEKRKCMDSSTLKKYILINVIQDYIRHSICKRSKYSRRCGSYFNQNQLLFPPPILKLNRNIPKDNWR